MACRKKNRSLAITLLECCSGANGYPLLAESADRSWWDHRSNWKHWFVLFAQDEAGSGGVNKSMKLRFHGISCVGFAGVFEVFRMISEIQVPLLFHTLYDYRCDNHVLRLAKRNFIFYLCQWKINGNENIGPKMFGPFRLSCRVFDLKKKLLERF